MRTILAMIVKFTATLAASWIAFGIVDVNSLNWILIVAVAGTVLNYIIGDLIVLPSAGNIVASLGDGILAAVTAYVIDFFTYNFLSSVNGLITFAAIVMFAEYFFHIYLFHDEKTAPNEFHKDIDIE